MCTSIISCYHRNTYNTSLDCVHQWVGFGAKTPFGMRSKNCLYLLEISITVQVFSFWVSVLQRKLKESIFYNKKHISKAFKLSKMCNFVWNVEMFWPISASLFMERKFLAEKQLLTSLSLPYLEVLQVSSILVNCVYCPPWFPAMVKHTQMCS
jgi:hypothetical protein